MEAVVGAGHEGALPEAAVVDAALVRAGARVDGGVPLGEAEAAREARRALLAAEGELRAGVADDVAGFDGLVRVVARLGLDAPR